MASAMLLTIFFFFTKSIITPSAGYSLSGVYDFIGNHPLRITFIREECIQYPPEPLTCLPCPKNCVECDNEYKCSKCAFNYALLGTGICFPCPNNCLKCLEHDQRPLNTSNSSLYCEELTFITDLQLMQLIECPNNCSSCLFTKNNQNGLLNDFTLVCYRCREGFALDFMLNCIACPKNCRNCEFAFKENFNIKVTATNNFYSFDNETEEFRQSLAAKFLSLCLVSDIGFWTNQFSITKCPDYSLECGLVQGILRCFQCLENASSQEYYGLSPNGKDCAKCPINCKNCLYSNVTYNFTRLSSILTFEEGQKYGYKLVCTDCLLGFTVGLEGFCDDCPENCLECQRIDSATKKQVNYFGLNDSLAFTVCNKCRGTLSPPAEKAQVFVLTAEKLCETVDTKYLDKVIEDCGYYDFDSLKCLECNVYSYPVFSENLITKCMRQMIEGCSRYTKKRIWDGFECESCDTSFKDGGLFNNEICEENPQTQCLSRCLSRPDCTKVCLAAYDECGVGSKFDNQILCLSGCTSRKISSFYLLEELLKIEAKLISQTYISINRECKPCLEYCELCHPLFTDLCLQCSKPYNFDETSRRCTYCPEGWKKCRRIAEIEFYFDCQDGKGEAFGGGTVNDPFQNCSDFEYMLQGVKSNKRILKVLDDLEKFAVSHDILEIKMCFLFRRGSSFRFTQDVIFVKLFSPNLSSILSIEIGAYGDSDQAPPKFEFSTTRTALWKFYDLKRVLISGIEFQNVGDSVLVTFAFETVSEMMMDSISFKEILMQAFIEKCSKAEFSSIEILNAKVASTCRCKIIMAEKQVSTILVRDFKIKELTGEIRSTRNQVIFFSFYNLTFIYMEGITIETISYLNLAYIQALYGNSQNLANSVEIKDFIITANENIDLSGLSAAFYFENSLAFLTISGLSVEKSSFFSDYSKDYKTPIFLKAEKSLVSMNYHITNTKFESSEFTNVRLIILKQYTSPFLFFLIDDLRFIECKLSFLLEEQETISRTFPLLLGYEGLKENVIQIKTLVATSNSVDIPKGFELISNLITLEGADIFILEDFFQADAIGLTGINVISSNKLLLKEFDFSQEGLGPDYTTYCLLKILNIVHINIFDVKISNIVITEAPLLQISHTKEAQGKMIRAIENIFYSNIIISQNYEKKKILSLLHAEEESWAEYNVNRLNLENIKLLQVEKINLALISSICLRLPIGQIFISNSTFVKTNQAIYAGVSKLSLSNVTIESFYAESPDAPMEFELAKEALLKFIGFEITISDCIFESAMPGKNGLVRVTLYESLNSGEKKISISNTTFKNNYIGYYAIFIQGVKLSTVDYFFSKLTFIKNTILIDEFYCGVIGLSSFGDNSKMELVDFQFIENMISYDSFEIYFLILDKASNSYIIFKNLIIKGPSEGRKIYSPKLILYDSITYSNIEVINCLFDKVKFSSGELLEDKSNVWNVVSFIQVTLREIEIEPGSGDKFLAFYTKYLIFMIETKFFNISIVKAPNEYFFREPDFFVIKLFACTFISKKTIFEQIKCSRCVSFMMIDDGVIDINENYFLSIVTRDYGVIWLSHGGVVGNMSIIKNCQFIDNLGGKLGGALSISTFTNITIRNVDFLNNNLTPDVLDRQLKGSAIYYFDEYRFPNFQFPFPQKYFFFLEECRFTPPLKEKIETEYINEYISLIHSTIVSPVFLKGNKIEGVSEAEPNSLKDIIIGSPVTYTLVLFNMTDNRTGFYKNNSLIIDNIDSGQALSNYSFLFYLSDENDNLLTNLSYVSNKSKVALIFHQVLDESSEISNFYFNRLKESIEVYFMESISAFKIHDKLIIWGPQGGRALVKLDIVGGEINLSNTPSDFYGNPLDRYNYDNPYVRFVFEININLCLIGQVYRNKVCQWCSNFTYILDSNSSQCKTCQTIQGVEYCEGSNLFLSPGFWRANETTDEILRCSNSEFNCLGGNLSQACAEGHIGPLCSECDIYAVKWNESYSKSGKRTCGKCSLVSFNILRIVIISLVTFISIVISVRSTTNFMKRTLQLKIATGIATAQIRRNENLGAIYLKVIVNYFQVISCIWTFDLRIPGNLNFLPEIVGTPLEQLFYSIDCFLITFLDKNSMHLVYVRLIFMLSSPFSYQIIFLVAYYIFRRTRKKKIRKSSFITSSLFIFLYMQPNIIDYCISLLSCNEIGKGALFIKADATLRCDSDSVTYYSNRLVIPTLLFFSVLLPGAILLFLIARRKFLELPSYRLSLGFLYNEYSARGYYWEFAKMYQRISLILILNFLDRFVNLKAMLVLLIVIIFGLASHIVKPYSSHTLNFIDQASISVSFFSILIALFVFNNVEHFSYLSYTLMAFAAIINIWFLLSVILNASFSYYLSLLSLIKSKKIPLLQTIFKSEIAKRIKDEGHFNPALRAKLRRAINKFKELKQKYAIFLK